MSESSSYKHSASDKKLDHAATDASASTDAAEKKHGSAGAEQGHDEGKIARHDDTGKDRLFEHREQHDDAEANSEKSRLAKDVAKHHHPDEDVPAKG
ncbi:MAG TPA: hypothetical protein VE869_11265 [Gemmatimonas sp.]|nr:hypothetical protein [Gemmatimonas sp.]